MFLERDSGGRRAQHGIRTGAGQPQNASGAPRPDRATRYIETTQGILSNAQLAPLVAREIETVEAAIYKGDYDNIPFDETLLLDIHRKIAAPFVPDWAGRWRDIPVTVGNWTPPPPMKCPFRCVIIFRIQKPDGNILRETSPIRPWKCSPSLKAGFSAFIPFKILTGG